MIIDREMSLQLGVAVSLACGHNSQCKRRLVAFPGIRNISPIEAPVIENFLLKLSNSHYRGTRGWSETNFTYTVKFANPTES